MTGLPNAPPSGVYKTLENRGRRFLFPIVSALDHIGVGRSHQRGRLARAGVTLPFNLPPGIVARYAVAVTHPVVVDPDNYVGGLCSAQPTPFDFFLKILAHIRPRPYRRHAQPNPMPDSTFPCQSPRSTNGINLPFLGGTHTPTPKRLKVPYPSGPNGTQL